MFFSAQPDQRDASDENGDDQGDGNLRADDVERPPARQQRVRVVPQRVPLPRDPEDLLHLRRHARPLRQQGVRPQERGEDLRICWTLQL